MNYWLVKQEPTSYPFSRLMKDGKTDWTGVRNFQARNNLRQMKKGDWVYYYHSVEERRIVGLARVTKEAFPDPTAEEGDWVCVEIEGVHALNIPVTLEQIKSDPVLKEMALVRQSRLSVTPLETSQAHRIKKLSE